MILMILILLLTGTLNGNKPVLDKQLFYICNKVYPTSCLKQWGEGNRDIGTDRGAMYQKKTVWRLIRHATYKNFFNIINEESKYRLSSWNGNLVVYNGHFTTDDLWKLVETGRGDGYYYIYNYWSWGRLSKYGAGNQNLKLSDGPKFDSDLWRLVPRDGANL